MKNFVFLVTFILSTLHPTSAQVAVSDSLSHTRVRIQTSYGSLTIDKNTQGQNSFMSMRSGFDAGENCPVVDYTVWVSFHTDCEGALSGYELVKKGEIKCLNDAVETYCREILGRLKEKNIPGLFPSDPSKWGMTYRLPIRISANELTGN